MLMLLMHQAPYMDVKVPRILIKIITNNASCVRTKWSTTHARRCSVIVSRSCCRLLFVARFECVSRYCAITKDEESAKRTADCWRTIRARRPTRRLPAFRNKSEAICLRAHCSFVSTSLIPRHRSAF